MKVGIASLGCCRNLIDSEVILGILKKEGFEITNQVEEANVLIINTCAFIKEAEDESNQYIQAFAHRRSKGKLKALLVAGCLVGRYGEKLGQPFVDAFIAPLQIPHIGQTVKQILDRPGQEIQPAVYAPRGAWLYNHMSPRIHLTPKHYGYIKIVEGCGHRCTFCTIPSIRGQLQSRTDNSVIKEARQFLKRSAKELILIGQDTTQYGSDRGDRDGLLKLLEKLCRLEGRFWIRLLYTHPDEWTENLMDIIATEEKICKYADIPIQHVNPDILRAMGRRIMDIEELIKTVRSRIPGVALRTSVMVGFPGETEKNFAELLEFLKRITFERLGAFVFSPEKGTRASEMPDQVPEKVKLERFHRLMQEQQKIAFNHNQELLGQKMTVLVDEVCDKESRFTHLGRTQADAPQVDGLVYLNDDNIPVGEFVETTIVGHKEYDLIARRAG